MTHAEMVKRAEKWLRNSCRLEKPRRVCRCPVVICESVAASESPDAIGYLFGGIHTVVVECKVSVSDFRADQKKVPRQHPALGMGTYRYYLTPPGLLRAEQIPDNWGLLEAHSRTVRVVKYAVEFPERHKANEMRLLFSLARRHQLANSAAPNESEVEA